MAKTKFKLNYRKLAKEISRELVAVSHAPLAVVDTVPCVANITSDDCEWLTFTCDSKTFRFRKAGKDSWVETLKHSHRNRKNIDVKFDDTISDANGNRIPTDIHDH